MPAYVDRSQSFIACRTQKSLASSPSSVQTAGTRPVGEEISAHSGTRLQLVQDIYAVFSGVAMLLYWLLLINFSIFSMQISAFVLVCGRVLTEVCLFLLAALFLLVSFATAIAAMNHSLKDFSRIDKGMESLLEMTLSMYPNEALKEVLIQSVWVEMCIVLFTILISVVFLNLLVAQLNQAYNLVHEDMQGYARLTRGSIIVSTVESISRKRWNGFLQLLGLEIPRIPAIPAFVCLSLRWRLVHVLLTLRAPAIMRRVYTSRAHGAHFILPHSFLLKDSRHDALWEITCGRVMRVFHL